MARPTKLTADYFPHYTKHGKTIHALEARWGNDGYSFWFKVLEMLGATENHFIDCNNPADWEYLTAITRQNEETAVIILDLLAKLDAIDRELWQVRIIYSQNLVNGLTDLYRRRQVNVVNKSAVLDFYRQKYPNRLQSDVGKRQIKLNKIKSNKIKVKESKNPSPEALRLSGVLAELILTNNPDHRDLNGDREKTELRWAKDIDLLIRKDKQVPQDVEVVIRWCQVDEFWKGNILSGAALRKQYDRLLLRAKKAHGPSKFSSGAMEWLRNKQEEGKID